MTFSYNQILGLGLILAVLIMAVALAVLAVHALRLVKNIDGLVVQSKGIAEEAGVAVKDTVEKIGENAASFNKAVTGVAAAVVLKGVLRKVHKARKAKKALKKATRKGRKK
ncbi:MAG: hypothetical protein PUD55_06265 [Firmicutes bacterium]|nr:hypothetical protein [Bacillota bacterium]